VLALAGIGAIIRVVSLTENNPPSGQAPGTQSTAQSKAASGQDYVSRNVAVPCGKLRKFILMAAKSNHFQVLESKPDRVAEMVEGGKFVFVFVPDGDVTCELRLTGYWQNTNPLDFPPGTVPSQAAAIQKLEDYAGLVKSLSEEVYERGLL